ncbi:MAG: DotG/IcmE/VirB10 family protein, partial [Alphaproteobacteria bacterium]|nr:DotG/IcmE/VirB10 family protein [Alphaproteobacteria bacterium]
MNDDLDEDILDSEDGFDEFSQKSGLGDLIRRNAFAKVGVVIVVLVVVISVMVMFGGNKEEQTISMLPGGSEVTSTPGTENDIDPAYITAVEEQNEADLDRAIAEGESAIPVPIETADTRLEVPNIEEDTEDPLHRWRMLQEERVERQLKERRADVEPITVLDAEQQSEAVRNMSESMIQQMESVLSRNAEETTFVVKTLISNEKFENGTMANGATSIDDEPFEETKEAEVIIPAGKIVYGQMLLEANSDIPMNVLAQMVSGPLKGWKLLGQFQVMDDAKMLAITFNMAVNDKGEQYSVDAIMLNPDTGLAAMRTDIDNRYFKRILLPAAAEFVSSYAAAIEDSGATSVYVSGDTMLESEEESTDE